jgi:bacillithiol synthase
MKKHCIDLGQTGQFSQFFLDYLAGKEALQPFFTHSPKIESFRAAIDAKLFPPSNRQILQNALLTQYQGLELGQKVRANLDSITSENTYTVTTGHQLNLFTGPIYFIYKIVSTINLAKKLNEVYPDVHVVPVYWMATEDHDFDEINYFKLDGKKHQWNSVQTGAVGDFELGAEFKEFLKTVPFAADVFKNAYQSSKTLAEAVRKYVHELFGEEGLIVVDGHDPSLKSLFKSVIVSDLTDHAPFVQATQRTEELARLGYKTQVFPREINLFYLDRGIRERIEKQGDRYQVLNQSISFSSDEILKLAEENPERFSPNVVLRPLYQEIILPNLAYLGGPAEVIYWLQLKGVFEQFGVPFPVLLPRNFALILESSWSEKLHKSGLKVADVFQDFEHWKKSYIAQHCKIDLTLEGERSALASIFDQKGAEAVQLERSLKDSFEAGKVRALKILDQMARKLRKAEERRNQIHLNRVSSILDYVAPNGVPQERTVNMMQFYLANPDLIQDLLVNFDPLDFHMMVLEY